jgi:YMGG-like Gly-zipper
MKSPLAKVASLRVVTSLALCALAACGRDKASDRASADSALARDLALAGQQTSQQPTFQDTTIAPTPEPAPAKQRQRVVEQEPAPRRPAPTPRRQAPEPQRVAQTPPPPQPQPITSAPAPAPAAILGPAAAPSEIGAGVNFGLTSGSKVCSATNLPGDKLVATLNEAVTGTNGAVIPAGSTVVLEVTSVTASENAEAAQVAFRVRSVVVNDKTYNVDAAVTPMAPFEKSKVAGTDPNADKKKEKAGAIAGAILGQMIGHNTKGTVIGAAAGAAAGAAVAKSGERWQACLPAGAPLRLTLNAPLVISS